MSNFKALLNYQIPSDLLLKLLEIYKLIGKYENLENQLENSKDSLNNKRLEKDTCLLIKYLNLNLSDQRIKLLISKDSTPRTKEEASAVTIKKILKAIVNNAYEMNASINSIDILDFLKGINGSKVKINSNDFLIHGNKKRSIRYEFNTLLDEFEDYYTYQKYEPISLSCITIMEMYNIKPYSEFNNLSILLTLYYLLLRCKIISFKYVSFMELYLAKEEQLLSAIANGSINYDQGTLFFTNFISLILDLIKKSYEQLDNLLVNNKFEKRAHKSDNIEQTIIYDLPDLFSKEDIIRVYPDVSLSTIMRTLTKLNKLNYIIPLGKGRSAKWKKIIDPNDINFILGVSNDENKD